MNIKKYFKLYPLYLAQNLKSRMEYRLDFFIGLLGKNIIARIERWRRMRTMETFADIVYCIVSAIFIAGLSVFPGVSYMFFLFL